MKQIFVSLVFLLALNSNVFCGPAEDYFKSGQEKMQKGDFDGAIADCTKAIEFEPAPAYYNRGVAKKAKGDLAGAMTDFTKAIEIKPDYPEAYVNRGLVKQDKGDVDSAMVDFTKAIELKPDLAEAYLDRGGLKGKQTDVDGAIADFTKAIEFEPAPAYYGRGVAKIAKGDLAGAMTDFTKAIEIKPDYPEAYVNRGLVKQDKGDVDGAMADFTKAIELKPDIAEAYGYRGILKQGKGDLEGAIIDYDKAIELKPGLAEAYVNRGIAKTAKGDLAGATADYNKAIELKPGYAEAYYSRGNRKRDKGDLAGASADYSKAIAFKPGYAEAYNNRGVVKQNNGDFDGAMADFTKAIELKPDSAQFYNNRASVNQKRGAIDGSIADFTKVIELQPENFEAYNNRGWSEYLKSNFDGAISDATRAIQLDPKNAPAYGTRGWARYGKGDLAGALEDCKKAVELHSNAGSSAAYDQGMVDFINGEYQKAIDSWQGDIQHDASLKRELQPWIEKAKARAGASHPESRSAPEQPADGPERESEAKPAEIASLGDHQGVADSSPVADLAARHGTTETQARSESGEAFYAGQPGAATNLQHLRVVVLPFQNATGDTNWNDWQLALPVLMREKLDGAEFMSVVGRKDTRQALQRAGWTSGREMNEKLAGEVATDLHAKVAVWGSFRRETNQWIVRARMLNLDTNLPVETGQIEVVSENWRRLPELLATNLAGHLHRPITERDLQYSEKYLTDSETALELLAHAIALDEQKQPAEEEKVLKQLLAVDARCGLANCLLISIYGDEAARSNELSQAVHEFVRQCPDLCEAHLDNASLLGNRDDAAGCKRELLEALRVHPGCPESCEGLFELVGAVGQHWEELQTILEQAHAVRHGNLNNTILLACARSQCHDLDGAHELLKNITDLPEENEVVDIALLVASGSSSDIELAGGELARLGPQAVTNEEVRATLESFKFYPRFDAPIAKPRCYTPDELNAELARLLTTVERQLVVNPVEITPEIAAEARQLTVGFTNDALRTIALLAEVARHGRGGGETGSRTAGQTLAKVNDPQAGFSCQEYAKLFVALARSLGMESWLVHIDRDANGKPGYHDCAVVFLDGTGVLVDPTWRALGIRHEEFSVLDDLQAISHQAMQLKGSSDPIRLRMGLKLNPTNRWTQLQFVRGMAGAGEFDAAETELRKVRSTGVDTWDVHDAAAAVEVARNRWEPALTELKQALALSPSNALVHFHLANVYQQLNDPAKSAEHAQRTLDFNRGEFSGESRSEVQSGQQLMNALAQAKSGNPDLLAKIEQRAQAGDVAAQKALAVVRFEERPPRNDEALHWLLAAAGQGDDQAQEEYARNLLVLKGNEAATEAVQWFTRAAKQGNDDAQYQLGLILYEGKLVAGDNVAAGQWILLSKSAGNEDAKKLWQEMGLFLSATEQVEAQKRAAEFKPQLERKTGNGNWSRALMSE